MKQIIIENDGELIRDTNYFGTAYFTERQLSFLSMNAGALRLLAPNNVIQEIKTGIDNYIINSQLMTNAYDIVFDDYTETPFSIVIMQDMIERPLQNGRFITLYVYTEKGLQHSTVIDISV